MRFVRVCAPFRNATSWLYLIGLAIFWSLARMFQPYVGGARLRGVWLPPCPLKALSGIPCPFCGLTTGSAWIARGEWREALNCNILSPVLVVLSAALAVYTLSIRIFAGRRVDWEMDGRARRRLWLAGGSLTAISWLVNLLRAF